MKDSKIQGSGARRLPPNAGKGRRKGSENRIPKAVKDMIHEALDRAGGAAYLQRQAIENPAAFLALVGKLIPVELSGKTTVTYKLINAVPEDHDHEDEPAPLP